MKVKQHKRLSNFTHRLKSTLYLQYVGFQIKTTYILDSIQREA